MSAPAIQFFGTYLAKAVQYSNAEVLVQVPQVLADVQVPLAGWTTRPAVGDMGLVSFVGGDPSYPVWIAAEMP
jgi:hypothetical protein